jgi:hypothetical protein
MHYCRGKDPIAAQPSTFTPSPYLRHLLQIPLLQLLTLKHQIHQRMLVHTL